MNQIVRSLRNAQRIVSLRAPLTDEQIRAVAPSVFAEDAHDSRSAKFVPVATSVVLDHLRREGFMPFYAAQSKTRDADRKDYTRHMLRLRHRSLANADGQAYEIVLRNANDGTSAYHMLPGFIRFACENGMIVGEAYDEVKVRHNGRSVIDDVIEGTYRVLKDAEAVTHEVEEFKGRWMTRDHQMILATAAHQLRFPDTAEAPESHAIKPAQLLHVRRKDDLGDDLWTAFNRIQENVIRGGLQGRAADPSTRRGTRKVSTREVNGISQQVALNRALWTLTQEMNRLASSQHIPTPVAAE